MKNRKMLAIFCCISICLNFLCACSGLLVNFAVKANANLISTDSPYYSVTTALNRIEKNYYMEVDVKIPKIVNSETSKDDLIDPVNNEIMSGISSIIENAETTAKETFELYYESAKSNVYAEREAKVNALKAKYKNVISSDEVKAISELLNTEIKPNTKGLFGPRIFGDTNYKISSSSNSSFDKKISASDTIVNGFTETDLIIPGLHNKNIIVIEKSEKATDEDIKETTISIEGRPGSGSRPKSGSRPRFASFSDAERPPRDFGKNLVKADVGQEYDDTEITVENFYKELDSLKYMSMPSDRELLREFIPTKISCSFDVKCLDEEYLSLFIELSESRTTTSIKRYFYNIDLNNKKLVKITDILGSNFKNTCIETVKKSIEKWDDEQKSKLKENYNLEEIITENVPFFINNNHKAVIEIEKFAITAGSAGYLDFQII